MLSNPTKRSHLLINKKKMKGGAEGEFYPNSRCPNQNYKQFVAYR